MPILPDGGEPSRKRRTSQTGAAVVTLTGRGPGIQRSGCPRKTLKAMGWPQATPGVLGHAGWPAAPAGTGGSPGFLRFGFDWFFGAMLGSASGAAPGAASRSPGA
jgi:hypothetical protein